MQADDGLLKVLFGASGRLSKKKYLRGLIFWVLPVTLAFVQVSVAESLGNRLWLMFAVGCLVIVAIASGYSGIVLALKRSRDVGRSGFFVLMFLVPFVGIVAFLYLVFARSAQPVIEDASAREAS